MKLAKLLDKNKDGVSFKKVGLEYKPIYLKRGYFVGLTNNQKKKVSRKDIADIDEIAKKLSLKTYFYGYWLDEEKGIHYLDLSIHVNNKEKAITLARLFCQKAIFDCYKIESLYI